MTVGIFGTTIVGPFTRLTSEVPLAAIYVRDLSAVQNFANTISGASVSYFFFNNGEATPDDFSMALVNPTGDVFHVDYVVYGVAL